MSRSNYVAMEKQGQRNLRRESAEVHAECKSVPVHLMENRQARKISSADIIAWKDQKCKLHFGILRSQESRLFNTRVSKLRKVKPRNPETGTSNRVSNTGRLRSQESRLFNTGVRKLRNMKPRNQETGTSTGVSDTGRLRSQDSRCWRRKSLLDCLQEQSPTPISFMSRWFLIGDQMDRDSGRYYSNSETVSGM
jgi:hypothetical protein